MAVATDLRPALSEDVSQYLGNKDLKTLLPGFEGRTRRVSLDLG